MILDAGSKFHDDCRLVAMAVKKRWPISEDVKQRLVERLATVAFENPDDQIAIKAASVLKSMEQQNQKDEQTAVVQSDRNRFLEIAQRLGIAHRVERIERIGTGSIIEPVDEPRRRLDSDEGSTQEAGDTE